jgi:N utilization substance protein A
MKVYVTEVKRTTKGHLVTVSRTRPGLVLKLFEEEIPEIHDGIVEIKSISREAGSRTKIAVYSKDPNVDPIGSCIGAKGTRVQSIVDELNGEKIDIVKYSDDPKEFITASLNPAEVISLDVDVENKEAYYQSEIFGKVLQFIASNPCSCKLREQNNKRSILIQDVRTVSTAYQLLKNIL